jgi:hypothetical protein
MATSKKRKKPTKSRKPVKKAQPAAPPGAPRLYTLEVELINGPVTEQFVKENPRVARTIQVRGDQTLADLHEAIFDAFDREEEHMYEYQFGKKPMDRKGARYRLLLNDGFDFDFDDDEDEGGDVIETTLDAVNLHLRQTFFYWFDFGDDWWHAIHVKAIESPVPAGDYPRVTERVGASPPQYPDLDDEDYDDEDDEGDEDDEEAEGGDPLPQGAAADVSCLIGEMHLKQAEYEKAVEAFTRAIEGNPTRDVYEGRAKAYRALAERDQRKAQELGEPARPAKGDEP